jgi:rod shape-determining protein MreC
LRKLSKERRAFILFLCLSLLSALLITVDYHGKGVLGLLKDIGFLVLKPVNYTVQNVVNRFEKYFQIFTQTESIHQKNWQLQQENREILHENAILKEKLAAYEQIAKMVQFKEYYNYEMIPAQVIGREPSNWFHSVIIDMGSKDGVEIDMGVATYRGLVGKVIQVGHNTSEVILLIDQGCSMGALIQRTREIGVIKGGTESAYCYLDYIAHDADVQINDIVVTSGMGSSVPKGIIIGRIVAVRKEKHDLFQRILIKPEVDFNKLEEVYIVKLPEYE